MEVPIKCLLSLYLPVGLNVCQVRIFVGNHLLFFSDFFFFSHNGKYLQNLKTGRLQIFQKIIFFPKWAKRAPKGQK